MKALSGLTLVVFCALGLSLAFSSTAPERPPGISADRWAPISDTLGVVLVPDSDLRPEAPPIIGSGNGELIAPPTAVVKRIIEEGQPVRGYIVVRRGKVWRPLAVVAPTVSS